MMARCRRRTLPSRLLHRLISLRLLHHLSLRLMRFWLLSVPLLSLLERMLPGPRSLHLSSRIISLPLLNGILRHCRCNPAPLRLWSLPHASLLLPLLRLSLLNHPGLFLHHLWSPLLLLMVRCSFPPCHPRCLPLLIRRPMRLLLLPSLGTGLFLPLVSRLSNLLSLGTGLSLLLTTL